MKKLCVIFLAVVGLSACSSLPTELVTDSKQPVTNYQQWVNTNPSQTVDVRLGGVISKVTNLQDKTRIEIVNLPIDAAGKPDISQEPQGRFVAYLDGFVEPMTFSQGRLITVAGKSMPPETDKVGDYNYTFPVMNATGQHLWTIEKTTYIENDFMMGGCFRGAWRCGGFGYGPTRAEVIQQVK